MKMKTNTDAISEALTQAIADAMADSIENNGSLTPHNPAIVRDGEGFSYQSALHPHDGMVWNMQEGLGNWTPENCDEIDLNAAAAAEMIIDEGGHLKR
jgi:hypothetical protein